MTKLKFNEFNIKDMYAKKDGTLCLKCKKGLRCDRHGLKKMDILSDSDDFERV